MLQVAMTTAPFWRLTGLSDQQLLHDLSGLLDGGARVEARLVAHLAEVEERRLHLRAATSSLFDYCLRRLQLSESEAFHRINAARLARRFPVIFELLETRSIHLSALRALRDHLTPENHRELLALASGKSKKEIELLVATRSPRPPLPSRIRRLPPPRRRALASTNASSKPVELLAAATAVPLPAADACAENPFATVVCEGVQCSVASRATEAPLVGALATTANSALEAGLAAHSGSTANSLELAVSGAPAADLRVSPSSTLAVAGTNGSREPENSEAHFPSRSNETRTLSPLSSDYYLLRVSIRHDFKNKLERARALMSHANPSGDLATVLEKGLELLLEKLEKQHFARTQRPRSRRSEFALSEDPAPIPSMKPTRDSTRNAAQIARQTASPRQQHARSAPEVRQALSSAATRREHVPNEVRRAVALRDQCQCTYVEAEGRRCASRAFLQLHHEHAHALGGRATLDNLRLLCGPHNRLLAERDFGRAHQERFTARRSSSDAQELGTSRSPQAERVLTVRADTKA